MNENLYRCQEIIKPLKGADYKDKSKRFQKLITAETTKIFHYVPCSLKQAEPEESNNEEIMTTHQLGGSEIDTFAGQ